MQDVRELVARLSQYHWSPNHPSSYLTPEGRGLGKMAHACYGSFNLIWATHSLQTVDDHVIAMGAFSEQVELSKQVIKDTELGWWLTLLQPHEFAVWFRDNRQKVNSKSRSRIVKALNALQVLR